MRSFIILAAFLATEIFAQPTAFVWRAGIFTMDKGLPLPGAQFSAIWNDSFSTDIGCFGILMNHIGLSYYPYPDEKFQPYFTIKRGEFSYLVGGLSYYVASLGAKYGGFYIEVGPSRNQDSDDHSLTTELSFAAGYAWTKNRKGK